MTPAQLNQPRQALYFDDLQPEYSPISIVIGAQSDEGKRGRMRRRAI